MGQGRKNMRNESVDVGSAGRSRLRSERGARDPGARDPGMMGGYFFRVVLWVAVGAGMAVPFSAAQRPGVSVEPAVARQMHEAVAAAEHGDEKQALERVGALLRDHPSFAPALKLQGLLLEDAGDTKGASESYAKALKLLPNDPELLLKVGVNALVAGDTDEAIALLERRAKMVPRDELSFYYVAQAYHRKGANDLALKAIRTASTLAPNSAPIAQKYGELLCSSGDNVEALRLLTKAQKAEPTLERINFDFAVASYNNMDLEQAVTYAARETEIRPDDLDAFTLLAAAEVKLTQWKEAETPLLHVLAVRKDDAPLLLQLGHCELELQQYQEAVDALNHSLQVDPTQAVAHFFLSRALAGLGKTEEAKHEAELHQRMMQQISFDVPKAEQAREAALEAQARTMLETHHEDEALRLFSGATAGANSSKGHPYMAVGATYLSMGDGDDARRALNQALQLDPKVKGAHIYLGVLALQQGDLTTAEHEFEAELAGDPNHPVALAELGEVRYRQKNWAEAAKLFVKSKTTDPRFLYMLTDCDFHVNDVKGADLTAEALAAYARDRGDVMQGLIDLLTRNGQADVAARVQAMQRH